MTIQELARQYANLFVTKQRANGNEYLCIENENEDLRNLIYKAHNDMMPDDIKYQFIYEALEAIAETDDIDDICLEPDVYKRDLLKWVSSTLTRASYIDEAVEDIGYKDFYNSLAIGQLREKDEVLHSVISSLEELI